MLRITTFANIVQLQTEVLEKDRERDQQKEAFRRELMKKSDEV